jgi:hypothetical protein
MELITGLLLVYSSFLSFTWTIPFILFSFFKLSIYRIQGQTLQKIYKHVKIATIWNNNDPEGWIIGFWYIGYIQKHNSFRGEQSKELYLLTYKKFYDYITKIDTKSNKLQSELDTKSIQFYEREGQYVHLTYTFRTISLPKFIATGTQKYAIEQIIKVYKEKTQCTAILHGLPGTGKSMISLLLAQELISDTNIVSLVDTFNPFEPGDQFNTLYNKVNPNEKKTFIVIIDEIDIHLKKIKDNSIVLHKYIPIQIKNKCDWTTFFDRFDRKIFYPYTIFIMTTNTEISKLETYLDDPSYLRSNRIDLKLKID